MSEDIRKQLRTQGRYSDKLLSSDDRNKGRDRKQKVSPTTKVSPESRVPKRNSTENRGTKSSFTNESMSLKYEEQSDYKFSQLNDVKKAEQIDGCGKRDLSVTENGTSTIIYEPKFLHKDEGWGYFDRLRGSTKWHTKNIVIQGVEYPQPRLVAWYGPFPYTYSGATLEPAEMPSAVLEIKEKVESFLKTYNIDASFNSVLLNLYRNGKDSVAWHSDDELTMGISPTIASVSLGETRRFEMRQKMPYDENGSPSDQTANYVVKLAHGSLIVMTGCMQDDWQHRVPKEYHDKEERINLTFRTVYPLEKVASQRYRKRTPHFNAWNETPRKRMGLQSIKFRSQFNSRAPFRNTFTLCSLENLLKYNIDGMAGENLRDFAFALKNNILKCISMVENVDRDELEFLCRLTDGTQIDKNQKLITKKIQCMVRNSAKNNQIPDLPMSSTPVGREVSAITQCSNETTDNREDWKVNIVKTEKIDSDTTEFQSVSDSKELSSSSNNESIGRMSVNSVTEGTDARNEFSSEENSDLNCSIEQKYTPELNRSLNASDDMNSSPKNTFVSSDYDNFGPENLLMCDVDVMFGQYLVDYAFGLKKEFMKIIHHAENSEKDEFEFLCALIDDTQTEKAKKKIVKRMQTKLKILIEKSKNAQHVHTSQFPLGDDVVNAVHSNEN